MIPTDFPVAVTPAAITQVRRLMLKDGREGVFLRLGVKGGGCSGLEYVMRLDDAAREGDLVLELDGAVVRVDPKSARFVEGAVFDYTGNLIGGGFKFENPLAERSCGCGTSFTPRKPV